MTDKVTARLFLALWPDEATLAELEKRRDAIAWEAGASIQPTNRLHLTLHFIGQVPRDRIESLREELRVPGGAIALDLTWLDVWEDIAVLRPRHLALPLLDLQLDLSTRLKTLGLPVNERTFRPHVTLARKAANATAVLGEPIRWRSNGYTLAESDRGYHVLERYP